jgi:hypothetical protein
MKGVGKKAWSLTSTPTFLYRTVLNQAKGFSLFLCWLDERHILVGKPEGERPLSIDRHGWEDSIKVELQISSFSSLR